MAHDSRLDDELAAWTDRLLAGESEEMPEETRDLAEIAQQLQHMIRPDRRPPDAFRTDLTRRLKREWSVQYERPSRHWTLRPAVRLAALAASVVVVLVVIALLTQAESGSSSLQGTAAGPVTGIFVMMGIAAVGFLLVAWWKQHHGR